ncbi:MAG: flagellar biosynthesis protein FlhB [bacterium]
MAEDRSEPATPRRRSEARKKGQVAKSQEVSTSLILLFGFCMLILLSGRMYAQLKGYMIWVFSPAVFVDIRELNSENARYIVFGMMIFVIRLLAPFVLVIMAVGIFANYMQVGGMVTFESIKPNFKKINPISGFSRLFSMRAMTELVKSVAKISLIGYISYSTIKTSIPVYIQMMNMDIEHSLALFASTVVWLALKISALLLLLAMLDFLYQKYDFEKSIKMSKQEIKDEYKQREGDPLIRRRIREKQREIAMRRMMASVPHADVVITNPIELAIALQYDADEMHAPKVVAKGGGVVAEKIKQIAKDNNVPIVEDRALAQSLFRLADVDDYVPPQLFKAVAEILAYVYRISRKKHSFGI